MSEPEQVSLRVLIEIAADSPSGVGDGFFEFYDKSLGGGRFVVADAETKGRRDALLARVRAALGEDQ